MIQLFNIPKFTLNTSNTNILHDQVSDFEQQFAEYVGAKYAVGVSSATNAIFLTLKYLLSKDDKNVEISHIMPPVVANAITLSGCRMTFTSEGSWVGSAYVLKSTKDFTVVDSAQQIIQNQFKLYHNNDDLVIYSFYPTKPCGGLDGGMVVSNDRDKIDRLRQLVYNGFDITSENSWSNKLVEPGWKMYLSSIQTQVARESLGRLNAKQDAIAENRNYLNSKLELYNYSLHLYRVPVPDANSFIQYMKDNGVICGIHYKSLKDMIPYKDIPINEPILKQEFVSIPFHEALSRKDLNKIIELIYKWKKNNNEL